MDVQLNLRVENKIKNDVIVWIKKYFIALALVKAELLDMINGIKVIKLISNPIHINNGLFAEIEIIDPQKIAKKNKEFDDVCNLNIKLGVK